MRTNELEELIATFFIDQEGVIASMLFGSYAKGNQTDKCDVDIAVFYEHKNVPDEPDLLDMQESLSKILSHNVDLICLNTVDRIRGMQINETKKIMFNNKSTALNLFFTTLFVQYIEVKELQKRMEEGILNRKI